MTEYVQTLLISNLFRLFCLLIGLAFGYMGYRLFVIGMYEKGGELKAAFGDNHLTLKQVGPGVFFAFFGVLVICVGGFHSLDVKRSVPAITGSLSTPAQTNSPDAGTPADHAVKHVRHAKYSVSTTEVTRKNEPEHAVPAQTASPNTNDANSSIESSCVSVLRDGFRIPTQACPVKTSTAPSPSQNAVAQNQ